MRMSLAGKAWTDLFKLSGVYRFLSVAWPWCQGVVYLSARHVIVGGVGEQLRQRMADVARCSLLSGPVVPKSYMLQSLDGPCSPYPRFPVEVPQ
eukprot:4687122-Amphidinium_carterae.1